MVGLVREKREALLLVNVEEYTSDLVVNLDPSDISLRIADWNVRGGVVLRVWEPRVWRGRKLMRFQTREVSFPADFSVHILVWVATPNDLKLSDCGARRGSCEGGAKKEVTDVRQRRARTRRLRT